MVHSVGDADSSFHSPQYPRLTPAFMMRPLASCKLFLRPFSSDSLDEIPAPLICTHNLNPEQDGGNSITREVAPMLCWHFVKADKVQNPLVTGDKSP